MLKKLFEEDQSDRRLHWKDPMIVKKINHNDKKRQEKVYQILSSKIKLRPEEKYYAAMILQHGENSEDYKKTNDLCKEAMKTFEPAKWLYAASLDRYLCSLGKPQKFGTQFKKIRGKWTFWKFDPKTTDKQRVEYNVPRVLEQIERLKQLNGEK